MRRPRFERSRRSEHAARVLAETMAEQRRKMDAEKKPSGDDQVSTAERAVIDSAVTWDASTGTEATIALRDRVAELRAARKGR